MAVYTTIDNPEAYFQVKLWTGNSTNDRVITLDNTDADLDPDLLWIKKRTDDAEDWAVHDTVRGISSSAKLLNLNGTGAEETHGNNGFVSAVSADTFTLKTNDASGSDGFQYNNHNTDTYAAWCWKESATAGFDIVAYTGNATNRTISHSLSVKPDFMIVVCSAAGRGWAVWSNALAGTHALELNEVDAQFESTSSWNSTVPTSSVFSVGTRAATNDDGEAHQAYLFRSVQGYSKFGSYTGNGSTDGAFVYTGFRPAFIMVKVSNGTTGNWQIQDTKRLGYNDKNVRMLGNTAETERTDQMWDMLSNGFKLTASSGDCNGDGNTYTYMAFAEAPFVNSNGVPCNAR